MAERAFKAHALLINNTALNGVSAIGFNTQHRAVIVNTPDGTLGASDVDKARQRTNWTAVCTDVTKIHALLAASPGATTRWYEEVAGSDEALWALYNLQDAALLIESWRLLIPKEGDSTLTVSGRVRYDANDTVLSDILQKTQEVTDTAATLPTRLRLPRAATFTPEGGSAIATAYVESLELSMQRAMIEDGADDDIGMTAVDGQQWGPLQVALSFKSTQKDATIDAEIADTIIDATVGLLQMSAVRAGTASAASPSLYTIQAKNVNFHSKNRQGGQEYAILTLNGTAGFVNNVAGTPATHDLSNTAGAGDGTGIFSIIAA